MTKKTQPRIKTTLSTLVLLLITACNLPGDEVATELDPGPIFTAAAQTLQAEFTQTAEAQQPPTQVTETTPTPPSPSPTEMLITTATLEPPTPSQIFASTNTNCRNGPGAAYEVVGSLLVGEQASVHGKLSNETWWYIENPRSPGTFCWVWSGSTTVTGGTTTLSIVAPPPPPTHTSAPATPTLAAPPEPAATPTPGGN